MCTPRLPSPYRSRASSLPARVGSAIVAHADPGPGPARTRQAEAGGDQRRRRDRQVPGAVVAAPPRPVRRRAPVRRAHARELAEREDPEPDRHAAAERIVSWYLHHAAAASWLQPCRQGPPERRHRPAHRYDFGVRRRPAGACLGWRPSGPACAPPCCWRPNGSSTPPPGSPRTRCSRCGYTTATVTSGCRSASRGCNQRRRAGTGWRVARMLDQISAALIAAGRPEAAAIRIDQARALWRELGDDRKATVAIRGSSPGRTVIPGRRSRCTGRRSRTSGPWATPGR